MEKRIIPVMVVFLMTLFTGNNYAQDDQLPKARDHYQEVKTEVLKIAADAQLVQVYSKSDIVLPGISHNWQYIFKSESNKRIYQFEYEEDRREISQVQVEPESLKFNEGMNTLPENWIDSDQAIQYSDQYGGIEYRNTHSGNYHIELIYLPAVKDGTNALYTKSVCAVHYAGEDQHTIPVDIVTGDFFDVANPTAKQLISDVNTVARRNESDAELIKVNGSSVEVNGKFWLWLYIYKSIYSSACCNHFMRNWQPHLNIIIRGQF